MRRVGRSAASSTPSSPARSNALIFDAPTSSTIKAESDKATQKALYKQMEEANKARDELDKLMVKYGVKTKEAIRQEERAYGKTSGRYYDLQNEDEPETGYEAYLPDSSTSGYEKYMPKTGASLYEKYLP